MGFILRPSSHSWVSAAHSLTLTVTSSSPHANEALAPPPPDTSICLVLQGGGRWAAQERQHTHDRDTGILIPLACAERPFTFVNKHLNWTLAQAFCRERCTDLVTVSDQQENQKLMELAEDLNECIWIGIRQNSDNWRWSSGAPPSSLSKHDKIWAMAYGKYILEKTSMTWENAQDYCRTKQAGDLASIHQSGDLGTLISMLPFTIPLTSAWIGLYRDPWSSWSDNTNTNFYNWESEPPVYPADDRCGCLSADSGKWHEELCSGSKRFICYGECRMQRVVKVKFQSEVDLNNLEIQDQIIEQMKNRLGPVGESNLTVKWRATTKTFNGTEPIV
ncbi:hypothetical protein WMY93_019271 [Mugilogobius chulae]|uniref:C-type lectin domain-containing protein n=1 Tax=Mugilogobius chulae TaxID=88201 RepID=A0AAW0NF28_9GOBI